MLETTAALVRLERTGVSEEQTAHLTLAIVFLSTPRSK